MKNVHLIPGIPDLRRFEPRKNHTKGQSDGERQADLPRLCSHTSSGQSSSGLAFLAHLALRNEKIELGASAGYIIAPFYEGDTKELKLWIHVRDETLQK